MLLTTLEESGFLGVMKLLEALKCTFPRRTANSKVLTEYSAFFSYLTNHKKLIGGPRLREVQR